MVTEFETGRTIFLFATVYKPALWFIQSSIQWTQGGYFPERKAAGV